MHKKAVLQLTISHFRFFFSDYLFRTLLNSLSGRLALSFHVVCTLVISVSTIHHPLQL